VIADRGKPVTTDWDNFRRRIENDPNTTPEMKRRMLEMMNEVDATVATNIETDPEVLRQVREFDMALDDIYRRLYDREIDGPTFHREIVALYNAVPMSVLTASNAIQGAMIAALRIDTPKPDA
jgi:hypothetical protein